ncbi:hypothetical protein E2C01_021821 [Portunus trituberculatus]|uniref:Uncharacterized protein n=1 Tax=Portunus trituberculatus TaxID=210409 RepID=A0A5B7E799_PORTR|nr:hypothetical protein [Portunus trituberculatus]
MNQTTKYPNGRYSHLEGETHQPQPQPNAYLESKTASITQREGESLQQVNHMKRFPTLKFSIKLHANNGYYNTNS